MTADEIISLLRCKHSRDIFVTECRTGSSWFGGTCRIMDAYVVRRSWTQSGTVGYEVKIQRADFLRDKKWTDYIPFCHEFYFVTPWGLINPDDVPDPAGLLYVTKNKSRLYTKKRATRQRIKEPIDVYLYLLIARTMIVDPSDNWQLRIRGHDARRLLEDFKGSERVIRELKTNIRNTCNNLSDVRWRARKFIMSFDRADGSNTRGEYTEAVNILRSIASGGTE